MVFNMNTELRRLDLSFNPLGNIKTETFTSQINLQEL